MIIGVREEFSPIPSLQLHRGMKFKMSFARVLGVEAKDAAGDSLRPCEGDKMIELRGSGIGYFRDDRRGPGVIAGPARADRVESKVDVDVAVVRDVGVRKDELPVAGELWVLCVSQVRNSYRVRLPKPGHLIDLRSRERDRSRRRRRRAQQEQEKQSQHGT